jgi:hypothetical protein
MQSRSSLSLILLLVAGLLTADQRPLHAAEKAAQLSTLGRMAVKEITVFKDGHCFVAQEGQLPTDPDGNVLLDQLPQPVIGTFWPYTRERTAKLTGVVASQRRVIIPRTALTLRELLEANVGGEALITEVDSNRYSATIVGFPVRSAEEQDGINPPNSPARLPEKGKILLLRTTDGTKALDIGRITDVTFKNQPKSTATTEEFRNLLTLKLDWSNRARAAKAQVGVFYLQKGVRWIPSYKVELDGKGQATMKLQATIINELTDLVDTDLNLVIGVPTFAFKDTLDPMALQQNLAQLSEYFQGRGDDNRIANNFSNAIMSQSARMSEYRSSTPPPNDGPDLPEGTKTEDLFVFSLKKITLKKGERMVVPVTEYTLPYRDVFTLDLPFAPPPEVRGSLNSQQQQELARLFSSPKVAHKARLTNKSKQPLTTAPALILSEGRVLAQGMMTYTAPGAESDLNVTTAVDVSVKKSDVESERVANALKNDSYSFFRINLNGMIKITNHRAQPVTLEVTRHILGNATEANLDGKAEKMNVFENGENIGSGDYPSWWQWYGWPNWWHHVNGLSRVTWKLTLEPGKTTELTYQWYYHWR